MEMERSLILGLTPPMDRLAVGAIGVGMLAIGIHTLRTWRQDVQRIIKNSHPGMERFMWVVGGFTYNFVAVMSLLFGCLLSFSFVTGQDWPLHHAKWSDLWPF